MRRHVRTVWYLLVTGLALYGSGVIPAIIPALVPAANKQGSTGQKFVIGTGNFTAGNCPTTDASGNLVDSGIATCGGAGTAVNSWNGATGAVTYTLQSGGVAVANNRLKLNFTGAITATDNAGTQATDVTVATASSGAIASRPAAGTAGRIYIPTDSYYSFLFDNGSSWVYTLNGLQITPPVNGNFSWANQGGASVVAQTNGAITLTAPLGAGDNVRVYYEAVPVLPFTKTYLVSGNWLNTGFQQLGVCFMESSSGKLVTFMYAGNNVALTTAKFNSVTSFGANYSQIAFTPMKWVWLQLTENTGVAGTLVFSYSSDGINFTQFDSKAKNDFFTTGPDRVGLCADSNNASFPTSLTLMGLQ